MNKWILYLRMESRLCLHFIKRKEYYAQWIGINITILCLPNDKTFFYIEDLAIRQTQLMILLNTYNVFIIMGIIAYLAATTFNDILDYDKLRRKEMIK